MFVAICMTIILLPVLCMPVYHNYIYFSFLSCHCAGGSCSQRGRNASRQITVGNLEQI